MTCGWVKIYRQLEENPLWTSEPFTRGQAWVDLIMLANHREGEVWVRDNCLKIKRGEIGRSEKTLAERWKWSRSKVRNFIKYLEKRQQVEQRKSHVMSTLSIVNYDQFQGERTTDRTTAGQQEDNSRTTAGQQQDTNKKDNNEKNAENENNDKNQSLTNFLEEGQDLKSKSSTADRNKSMREDFDLLWSKLGRSWPRKENRKRHDSEKRYLQSRRDGYSHDQILDVLSEYHDTWQGEEMPCAMHNLLTPTMIRQFLEDGVDKPTRKLSTSEKNHEIINAIDWDADFEDPFGPSSKTKILEMKS